MLDLKFIREQVDAVKGGLKAKRVTIDLDHLLALDQERRDLTTKVDELRSLQNKASEDIGRLVREKQDAKEKIAAMKSIADQISQAAPVLKDLEEKMHEILIMIPNIPHSSVQLGG